MSTIVSHMSSIPSTAGIYCIINAANHHCYIGSAVNLLRRKQRHFMDLKAGIHKNDHLQHAYDLYGSSAFQFHILEHVHNVEDLLAREQFFIDTRNPEYNIARVAGSTLGLTYSPEAKAKLSAARHAYSGLYDDLAKATEAARIGNTGRKLSPEHLAKLRGRKHTDEAKANMSAAQRGRKKSPEHVEKIRAANIGRKHTPEARENMGAPKRGRKQSPEHVAKRAALQRGKKLSPEHAAKSRVAFLGRKHTDEAREKMSAAHRGKKKSPEHVAKISSSLRGGKVSPERQAKATEAARLANTGKKRDPATVEKIRASHLGKKHSPETIAKIQATKAAKRAAKLAEQQLNQPPLF